MTVAGVVDSADRRAREWSSIAQAEVGQTKRSTGRVVKIGYCWSWKVRRKEKYQRTAAEHCCPDYRITTWLVVASGRVIDAREKKLGAPSKERRAFCLLAEERFTASRVAGCWAFLVQSDAPER